VHLPFCKQKCHYCDFATQIVGGNHQKSEKILDAMDAYTDFVCREITHQGRLRGTYDRTASRAKANGEKLETIFFGGGTPSLMSAKQMERLLASLENAFGIDWSQAEISMECDPGTFTRETLRSFVGLGVNRISLGAQSFDERVLQACGRTHGVLEIYESIEHVHALLGSGRRSISSGSSSSSNSNSKFSGGGGGKSNAIETWSIDLISGLPGSTLETWEKGLYEAIECEAPHVSAYDLQVEEKTAFGKWYGNDDDDGDDEADDELLLTDAFKNRDKRTEEMKRADAKAKTFEERMEEIRRETDDEYSLKQRKKLEKEKQNKKVVYKLGDRLPLPSETVVAEQYKLASEILTARGGFHRYEISSFAKGAENECKHNKNYWDAINGSWYAFGLSATSRIDNERLARPRGMKQYYGFVQDFEQNSFGSEEAYSQLRKDCTDEEVLDEIADAILERIMLGFRTARGVDVQELERSFGAKVVQELFDALRFVQETTNDESNDDYERKLYEITRDEKTNNIKAVRLTDPDGFLISTEIISTVISRMPSLKDA
jgi:coproporphyrinogen III oxidase-like Fe-S oxidoreductase